MLERPPSPNAVRSRRKQGVASFRVEAHEHRLAEAGCSSHASLAEVQRYIAAADRAKLARNAWLRPERQHRLPNLAFESA